MALDSRHLARHVGLIPDGGRRWARRRRVPLADSYRLTFANTVDYLVRLFARGTSTVSVYLLSRENLRRKPEELNPLFAALVTLCEDLRSVAIARELRVVVAGRREHLPEQLRSAVASLVDATRAYTPHSVYLCLAYDPNDEILDSLARLAGKARVVDGLWVPEQLDLVIRASRRPSLSNFLPLQSAYAELYFLPQLFNDLTWPDIARVLDEFEARDLRRGA